MEAILNLWKDFPHEKASWEKNLPAITVKN